MRIPKYWARGVYMLADKRGKKTEFSCWRWSDSSVAEAKQLADSKAKDIALTFQGGQQLDRYEYGRNPLREEIVQAVKGASGREVGMVTRNGYGALVLNAANAMFIDIDFAEDDSGQTLAGAVGKLFGGKAQSTEESRVQDIERWFGGHPDWGVRIYRTFGGLRCLITNELFDPTQAASEEVLQSLQSDPLYIMLCRTQESFRARLTPKPWRCGAARPPLRYPFESPSAESRYRAWEAEYKEVTSQYSACRLIKQIGNAQTHPDIAPILSVHDQLAGIAGNLPLA